MAIYSLPPKYLHLCYLSIIILLVINYHPIFVSCVFYTEVVEYKSIIYA